MTVPTRLLTRLGVDEALIGDLLEAQSAGRSRVWLWRQVVGAIGSVLAHDALARPLRTVVFVVLALLLRDLHCAFGGRTKHRSTWELGGR
jgi:hypothetical protein